MQNEKHTEWDGVERRNQNCRRSGDERRTFEERRSRRGGFGRKRSLKAWVRTLTNPRLGVDRRMGIDQRNFLARRDIKVKTLLTQEELLALLK